MAVLENYLIKVNELKKTIYDILYSYTKDDVLEMSVQNKLEKDFMPITLRRKTIFDLKDMSH